MPNQNSELIYLISRRLEAAKSIAKNKIDSGKWRTIGVFLESCEAEGLSKSRQLRYVYDLTIISQWLEPSFEKATRDDIQKLVVAIENSDYSAHTKYGLRVCIKKFYKWLKGKGEFFPEEVRWIRNNNKNNKIKTPEDMLTQDEMLALIKATDNSRDRAMVSVLCETGCRLGELLTCKIKSYQKSSDKRYGHLRLDGKTGQRIVPVISSVPYLEKWVNEHAFNNDPNRFLWIKLDGSRLSYARVHDLLRELAKRAAIRKRVNPHNFRHSAATYSANHLTEAQMKQYFGWTQGSDMAAVYVHLSGRDVDNAVLKMNGVAVNEEQKESCLTPKECTRCQKTNQASSKFCVNCGATLDKEEMERIIREDTDRQLADKWMNKLIQLPDVKEFLEKKVKEVMEKNSF